MTTTVHILSPKPNHQNVRVTQRFKTGELINETVLTEGASMMLHVYGSNELLITEEPKNGDE